MNGPLDEYRDAFNEYSLAVLSEEFSSYERWPVDRLAVEHQVETHVYGTVMAAAALWWTHTRSSSVTLIVSARRSTCAGLRPNTRWPSRWATSTQASRMH